MPAGAGGVNRTAVSAAAVALAAIVIAGLALAAYAARYEGRVYPGVRIAGTPVGGSSPDSLLRADGVLAAVPQEVTLVDPGLPEDPEDDRSWTFERSELGLIVDAVGAVEEAYAAGRDGVPLLGPLLVRLRGRDVSLETRFDADRARETLEALAGEVDVAPVPGDVAPRDGDLAISLPRPGRQLAVEETLERLAGLAGDPTRATLEIATTGTAPRFSDPESVARAYELTTSGPVRLTWRQGQVFTVGQEQVRSWVSLERAENPAGDVVPAIVFDHAAIADWISGLAAEVDRPPRAARLDYDRLTGELSIRQVEAPGQTLDIAGSVQRFIDAAYTDVRTAELDVQQAYPSSADRVLRELSGRVQILASAGTRIEGQPPGRGQNVLLAVDRIAGVAVAAGEEFSFERALGAVTAADGFDMVQAEAGGDGVLLGGIEQVSTGAFRAAVWAGLPILERHAPPSRLAWAEPPIGLDAAIAPGERDLRFRNDTTGTLLLDLDLDADRGALIASIVGVPPARDVALAGPIVTNVATALPPSVRTDPRLPPGQEVRVAWARDGADVAYQRIVRAGGTQLFADAFAAAYAPAGDVWLVGASP